MEKLSDCGDDGLGDVKRRGERPAFPAPRPDPQPLDGERVCLCGHYEGDHDVADECAVGRAGLTPCPCDQFEAADDEALPVEAS
jgi:hypothetical protein